MTTTERYIQQCKDFAELMKHYPFTMETLAGEEWRDIEGTDGKYQISNYGRVKSFAQRHRILKPFLERRTGYLACELRFQGKRGDRAIHRLVARAFVPNPDNKPQINHVDGIKWNACASNLEWVTLEENCQHALKTGLRLAGAEHPDAKLTNEQIIYVRENPDNLKGHELAKKFGITATAISYIQQGKTYRNAGGNVRKAHTPGETQKIPTEIRDSIIAEYVYGSREFGTHALAKKYGIKQSTVWRIIVNETEHEPSKRKPRTPDYIREQIRAEYVKGSTEFGSSALAKKYNLTPTTICRIVKEFIVDYKPKKKRPPIPNEIREEIRRIYIKGDPQFGIRPLARKYGFVRSTIKKIVTEK